jgi:predicted Co/Zn/Cd cation transporter (cation efflux family)
MHDPNLLKAEQRGLLASVAGSLLVGVTGVAFFFLTDAEAILLDGLFNLVYCATGLFTLKVARLVLRGDDERFPLGYAFFEPLVNGIKGILLLGLTLMAFFSALDALFSGGRTILLGPAVIYGVVAATVCWLVALVVRRSARRSGSPLVEADAASWIVNAAVSSAVLVTLAVVFLIRDTSLRFLADYVDPVLVITLCLITIGVPGRIARNALMEFLNRTPSPELLARVRGIVEGVVSDLPVQQLTVRVIQPGRTRLISAHVLLSPDYDGGLARLDEARAKADAALREEHRSSLVDLLFTADRRWSAPLGPGAQGVAGPDSP